MNTLDLERLHKVHFNILNGKLMRGQGTTTYQLVCLVQSLEFVDDICFLVENYNSLQYLLPMLYDILEMFDYSVRQTYRGVLLIDEKKRIRFVQNNYPEKLRGLKTEVVVELR